MQVIKLVYLILFIPILSSIAKPTDKKATPETINLFTNLGKLTTKGIMIGHQDDLAYGIGWKGIEGQSDIKRVCNDYPAVYGWDLGLLETGSAYNLDSVPFDKIREYVKTVYTRGGVNSFSWHANNPETGGNAWDITKTDVVKSILPGGPNHEKFKGWLDKLALFFGNLKDDQNTPIPVLFRPYHENTGSWFWWGKKFCTPEEYKNLWIFTIDYLRNQKKVHNLLLTYSATDAFTNAKEYLERYPGDDLVDIIGFDFYQFNGVSNSQFIAHVGPKLQMISQIAKEKGKLSTFAETGFEQIPDSLWWTNVLWPLTQGKNISYVLLWRNAHNRANHYYAPYPGQLSEKDFLDFYKLPGTLFQSDVTKENLYK